MQKLRERLYRYRIRYSDRIFDAFNIIFMCMLALIFIWPLWFVVIAAVSDPIQVNIGNVLLWPKGFTVDSFIETLKYDLIWSGYGNTIFYTVVGTCLNIIMTVCAAYPLSRSDFMARKFVFYLLLITMYFGGGLIPTYMVVRNLGLVNTRWAMIIPGACSVYNVIITRTYFRTSIPESLFEAATLDGANSFQYLMKIVLPLSKPILAVIALYYAVGHWNDYYTALIYLRNNDLLPLQSVLRDLLLSNKILGEQGGFNMSEEVERRRLLALTMRYSTIIISTLPVLVIYPFVQKYFVKGVMIGSVKE